MGWASKYISALQKGETVKFRPRGNSMQGKIESGQLCTVVPVKVDQVKTNDIVLCKVNGRQYLHLVRAINSNKFLICNNKGHDNGWAHANCVYGVVVRIED